LRKFILSKKFYSLYLVIYFLIKMSFINPIYLATIITYFIILKTIIIKEKSNFTFLCENALSSLIKRAKSG
jgi:hypothetical protein